MGVGASIYKESSIHDNPGFSRHLFFFNPIDLFKYMYRLSYSSGPGAYSAQGMGNVKAKKTLQWRKPDMFQNAPARPDLHPPSIPRLEQSYG